MEVIVKKSNSKKGKVVSWMGGRMSFSSYMSELLREELYKLNNPYNYKNLKSLKYLSNSQKQISSIPNENQQIIPSYCPRIYL